MLVIVVGKPPNLKATMFKVVAVLSKNEPETVMSETAVLVLFLKTTLVYRLSESEPKGEEISAPNGAANKFWVVPE